MNVRQIAPAGEKICDEVHDETLAAKWMVTERYSD